MAIVEDRPGAVVRVSDVHWSAVIAGAIAAAALSVVLLAFGTGIGLAVSSVSPTWRDMSFALWFLSGLYLVFVSLISFGFGGYVAGRMRAHIDAVAATDETEFRDGMHGLLSRALAVVIAAALAIAASHAVTPIAAPGGGSAGPSKIGRAHV